MMERVAPGYARWIVIELAARVGDTQISTAQVAETVVRGPDSARHREGIAEFEQAGFDHVYVHQVGPDQQGVLQLYEREVLAASTVR